MNTGKILTQKNIDQVAITRKSNALPISVVFRIVWHGNDVTISIHSFAYTLIEVYICTRRNCFYIYKKHFCTCNVFVWAKVWYIPLKIRLNVTFRSLWMVLFHIVMWLLLHIKQIKTYFSSLLGDNQVCKI